MHWLSIKGTREPSCCWELCKLNTELPARKNNQAQCLQKHPGLWKCHSNSTLVKPQLHLPPSLPSSLCRASFTSQPWEGAGRGKLWRLGETGWLGEGSRLWLKVWVVHNLLCSWHNQGKLDTVTSVRALASYNPTTLCNFSHAERQHESSNTSLMCTERLKSLKYGKLKYVFGFAFSDFFLLHSSLGHLLLVIYIKYLY